MKMKIFHVAGDAPLGTLQRSVDEWLFEENPTEVAPSQSVVFGENGVVKYILLTVFYK